MNTDIPPILRDFNIYRYHIAMSVAKKDGFTFSPLTANVSKGFQSAGSHLFAEQLKICTQGISTEISIVRRNGPRHPVLFLHGFGGSKEDYIDFTLHEPFNGRAFIAYDAPGCGATTCDNLPRISMAFLVDIAEQVLDQLGIQQFHLVGHSMGGLTALLLAQRRPESVLSFINIKGNLGPEDCFLSRQILEYGEKDANVFLDKFVERAHASPYYSSSLFAAGIRAKVRAGAVRGIFESMVYLSDHTGLLGNFLSLPVPKMFMYGNQYSGLSYLPTIKDNGVELAEVAASGHFPMYSNPVEMWRRIGLFLRRVEVYDDVEHGK